MLCDNKWWCRQIGRKKQIKKNCVKSEYLAEKVRNIFWVFIYQKKKKKPTKPWFYFYLLIFDFMSSKKTKQKKNNVSLKICLLY